MRRAHKYADGGKVIKSETDADHAKKKVKKADKKTSKLTEYAGMSVREKQMKDMGLKDGGKVEMKPHVPPRVKSPIKEKMKGKMPGGDQTPGAKGT